jgi:hypothetical protein
MEKIFQYQLLNVHGVNDVRQTERDTAETLVPECNTFDDENIIEKLRCYN